MEEAKVLADAWITPTSVHVSHLLHKDLGNVTQSSGYNLLFMDIYHWRTPGIGHVLSSKHAIGTQLFAKNILYHI